MKTRKLVLLAILVSQALILSLIESWIPVPIPVPGVKLGLANIITIIVIIFFDFRAALAVVAVRCILSAIFGGGVTVFLFSISGAVLSTIVMWLLYKRFSKVFSILGVSIAGAIAHNIGQIAMAVVVMNDINVLGYLPVLMISGIITGCFVGLCSTYLSRALKKII